MLIEDGEKQGRVFLDRWRDNLRIAFAPRG
jgi:hypothetical protein